MGGGGGGGVGPEPQLPVLHDTGQFVAIQAPHCDAGSQSPCSCHPAHPCGFESVHGLPAGIGACVTGAIVVGGGVGFVGGAVGVVGGGAVGDVGLGFAHPPMLHVLLQLSAIHRMNDPVVQKPWARQPTHCGANSVASKHVAVDGTGAAVSCVVGGGGGGGVGEAPPPPLAEQLPPLQMSEQQSPCAAHDRPSGRQKHVPTPFAFRQRFEQHLRAIAQIRQTLAGHDH